MVESIFVGLDVHARSVVAYALDPVTGQCWQARFEGAGMGELVGWCNRLPGPVQVVYEAGPTGFELARRLQDAGLGVQVAAPSKLPVTGDRVKTDRRDAKDLARWLAAGTIIVPVWIPDRDIEAARDLFRCREDAWLASRSSRQRLGHFLLRHDETWDKACWTKTHLAWLGSRHFADPLTQNVFDEYLNIATEDLRRVNELDKLVTEQSASPRWAPQVQALECLRGISTLTAFGLLAEIGEWTRLTPVTIGSYLGLVPSETSSGQTRHQGGITKTGNTHARRLLIEAAWIHHKPYRPASSPTLQRAFDKAPPQVRARADLANRRLNNEWVKHDAKGHRKIITAAAIARQLAGYCHDLAVMTS